MLKYLFNYFESLSDYHLHDLKLRQFSGALSTFSALIKPFKWLIAASAISGTVLTVIDLLRLWAIAHIIDIVAHSDRSELTRQTLVLFATLLAAYMIIDPIVWLVNYALRMQSLRCQTKSSVLWQAHKAATRHDMEYFHANHAGQIAGRVGQLSTAIQSGVEILAGRFPLGFVRFIGSAILILFLAPLFVGPIVLWIALNCLLAVFLVPKFNQQAEKISETMSIVNGAITEYFSNIRSIKILFAYSVENAFVLSVIDKQNSTNLETNRLTTIAGLCIRIFNTGLVGCILGLGLYGLLHGILSPGEFVAGVTLAGAMTADAGWFIAIWEGLTQTFGTIRDAQTTLQAKPTVCDGPDIINDIVSPPMIEFQNLCFWYGSKQTLNNISFDIRPGQKVGIVGPSGAGKSTLIDLLLRLYDVKSGKILLNGQDIRSVSLKELRQKFSVVSQNDTLFHRSVRDNIAFGAKEFSSKDIVHAAELADAANFISELHSASDGYETIVGERGARLSGGQQQRILLARAFLQRRPVLILDEATSALDTNSESLIQKAIAEYSDNTTVIAIAHRLSTVRDFDKIIVLDKGSVSAIGSHEELLLLSPLYHELWKKQSGLVS